MMQSSHAPMNIPQISRRRNRLLLSTCQPTTSRPVHNQKQKQNNRNFHFFSFTAVFIYSRGSCGWNATTPLLFFFTSKKKKRPKLFTFQFVIDVYTHTHVHPPNFLCDDDEGKSLLFKNFIFFLLLLLYIPSGVTRQKKNKKKKIPEARGAPLFCSVRLSVCGLLLLLVVASSYSTANDCNFRTHPGSQPNNKKEKRDGPPMGGWRAQIF